MLTVFVFDKPIRSNENYWCLY